ncbi:AAA family ATPase [Rhizobium fabae]|uniref:DNA repair protein n=1 Tax=Rhizobium fabae TaxID=573179 RepID=A0A7W6BBM4_9HYPH|nr:AAA family ATPase [Rhizobium fabae]MBB3916184.1 energy-coupling factor transporter ATP-binding protein EcfA2 [Rhizobium fabae]RUM11181.1 DNA repair protein [Rhizobium fabae]
MAVGQPKSAYQMILEWASSRPLWQQDALRRIVSTVKLNASDIDELTELCLKGKGKIGIELDPIPLSREDRLVRTTAGGTISLLSVSDVRHVNQLAAGQTLSFAANGLTVIYGDNGSGKSGYSRILKRACHARFRTEILPDEFDATSSRGASAKIEYADERQAMPPIPWVDDGVPNHTLSAVTVFDRESGAVHVREQSEIAFRPFGLDIPDELAAACVAIKERLTAEQTRLNQACDPTFSRGGFSPTTPVGRILANLKADTDLTPLEELSIISEAETERFQRLTEDLGRDPLIASAEQRAWAASLFRFADDLEAALAQFSAAALLAIQNAVEKAGARRATANLAAEALFGTVVVKGVGEEAWRQLWEAARRYSEQDSSPHESFPPSIEGAPCVLCQQPLGVAALQRMSTFEAFVCNDTGRLADEAEALRDRLLSSIVAAPIRIAAFPLRRQLAVRHPELARKVLRCLASARLRRAVCLRGAEGAHAAILEVISSPAEELRAVATKAERYAEELSEAADLSIRTLFENERDALRDRIALKTLLLKAKTEVVRLADLDRVAKCLGETNTKAITMLGNAIADEVVTPRIRDRFQEEIQKLAAGRVRVDVVRSGGKYGSPQYQVRLFANDRAKVHLVLSEGEQTCVALALFLTELATASSASTLVFDDPVSSLDHRWRQKVAERLVEEAKLRQIIVFTHDLVFLNDLQTLAGSEGVTHKETSLSRSGSGAGIVEDGLPWIGQRLPQRLDALEKEARAAKTLFDALDDEAYADAASKFYNRLRSTWERALEDVAFCNVVHRHRDYINAKDLKKVTALEAADVDAWEAGFKTCCEITDAHDPARGRNASPPPPVDLLKHVADLGIWVASLRDRHKQIS